MFSPPCKLPVTLQGFEAPVQKVMAVGKTIFMCFPPKYSHQHIPHWLRTGKALPRRQKGKFDGTVPEEEKRQRYAQSI